MKLTTKTVCLGLAAASGLLFSQSAVAAPLIVNGGFELPPVPLGTALVPVPSIPGWTATVGSIEVQSGNVAGNAHGGNQLLELDSCSSSTVEQTGIATDVNTRYVLDFWFSPRPANSIANQPSCGPVPGATGTLDNHAAVFWNGVQVTNIQASGLGLTDTVWTHYTIEVTPTGNDKVTFQGLDLSDTFGSYIDDVQVLPIGPREVPNTNCVVTAGCKETTNPSGKNVPTAGANPKSGQNPDGFYELLATATGCAQGANLAIFVKDGAEGPCGGAFTAGPYKPGDKVKLTQSPGQNSVKPMAGDIIDHINTKGDPILVAIDLVSGVQSVCTTCLVPPKPK